MSNGKVMIIHLIVGLIKKILLYKLSYFPDPYTHSKNEIKVEVDFSNFATKSDVKNATGFDTSLFAKNTGLASLKSDIDEFGIDKLKIVPVDLSKLNNV